MKKLILAVLLIQYFAFLVTAAENYNDDKYYVCKEAPQFEILSYEGEHYEDLVPYTLDLAEMARLAINGLTCTADADAGYELWFETWWTRYPPVMRHEMSRDCQAKFLGPLVLMRIITGSDKNLDIEKKIIESWLRSLDDKGMYHKPQRRWVLENVWEEDKTQEQGQIQPYGEAGTLDGQSARFLEAMMLYHIRDNNPLWTDILRKNFQSMLGDFKEGDEPKPREYEFSGEKEAHGSGWSIQALLQYSRLIALSFPIHSAMERLPAPKWLKSAQSLLGHAKKAEGILTGLFSSRFLFCCFLDILGLPAKKEYLSDNTSAKHARNAQIYCFSLPIS